MRIKFNKIICLRIKSIETSGVMLIALGRVDLSGFIDFQSVLKFITISILKNILNRGSRSM